MFEPIWVEGMRLSQQHLQQAFLFYKESTRHLFNCLLPEAWGVLALSVDADRLRQNTLKVFHLTVRWKEGDWFFSEDSLSLDLPQAHTGGVVWACLPNNQDITGLQGYRQPSEGAAYQSFFRMVQDRHDADRRQEVCFQKPNVFLHLGDTPPVNTHSLPLLKLCMDARGIWMQDTQFLPPLFWCDKHPQVEGLLSRCQHAIPKHETVWKGRLKRMQQKTQIHPKCMHDFLSDCLLECFQLEIAPYQHAEAQASFLEIETALNEYLQLEHSNQTGIPLKEHDKGFYTAETLSFVSLNQSDVLIQGTFEEGGLLKLASPSTIESCVFSALPGVELKRISDSCFEAIKEGPFWEDVLQERAMSVYSSTPQKNPCLLFKEKGV